MFAVDTREAEPQLAALLAKVEEQGETVLICRDGKAVAELRALPSAPDPLELHPDISRVVFHENPMAPLDPEDWPENER